MLVATPRWAPLYRGRRRRRVAVDERVPRRGAQNEGREEGLIFSSGCGVIINQSTGAIKYIRSRRWLVQPGAQGGWLHYWVRFITNPLIALPHTSAGVASPPFCSSQKYQRRRNDSQGLLRNFGFDLNSDSASPEGIRSSLLTGNMTEAESWGTDVENFST